MTLIPPDIAPLPEHDLSCECAECMNADIAHPDGCRCDSCNMFCAVMGRPRRRDEATFVGVDRGVDGGSTTVAMTRGADGVLTVTGIKRKPVPHDDVNCNCSRCTAFWGARSSANPIVASELPLNSSFIGSWPFTRLRGTYIVERRDFEAGVVGVRGPDGAVISVLFEQRLTEADGFTDVRMSEPVNPWPAAADSPPPKGWGSEVMRDIETVDRCPSLHCDRPIKRLESGVYFCPSCSWHGASLTPPVVPKFKVGDRVFIRGVTPAQVMCWDAKTELYVVVSPRWGSFEGDPEPRDVVAEQWLSPARIPNRLSGCTL